MVRLNEIKFSKLIILFLCIIIIILFIKQFNKPHVKIIAKYTTLSITPSIKSFEDLIIKGNNDENDELNENLSWIVTKSPKIKEKSNSTITDSNIDLVTNDDFNKTTEKVWNIPRPKIHQDIKLNKSPKFDLDNDCKSDLMIILCMSTAQNVAHRNVIRETWSNKKSNDYIGMMHFKLIFVIGQTEEKNSNLIKEINEESIFNNDLLIADFTESRYEYTRKFIVSLNWLINIKCNKIRYILRVIDDVYVNLPVILKWIDKKFTKNTNQLLYLGNLIHQDEPIRDILHPLYTSEEDYPEKYYPDYIRSPIYFFSFDTIKCLHDKMNSVIVLPMEDAYIGLLAKKCDLKPIHNEHFVLLAMPDNVCHHRRMFFIGHLKPIDGVNIFHNLKNKVEECIEISNNEDL